MMTPELTELFTAIVNDDAVLAGALVHDLILNGVTPGWSTVFVLLAELKAAMVAIAELHPDDLTAAETWARCRALTELDAVA